MKLGRFEIDKIYNEDCYKAIKELPDKCIDLVYIDIPYEYSQGGSGCFGDRKETQKTQIGGFINGIDYSILDDFVRICKYIYIYIWCSKQQIPYLLDYFVNKKHCFFNILTWHKTNPLPASNNIYHNDTEFCLCFRESGTGVGGNYETKSTYYISGINITDKNQFVHPTIKPLEFVKNHIINSSKVGDVVLDCFMGSGTTAVACKELNRHFLGFELNTDFWKIANDRVNGLTQQDRKLKEQGQIDMFEFLK